MPPRRHSLGRRPSTVQPNQSSLPAHQQAYQSSAQSTPRWSSGRESHGLNSPTLQTKGPAPTTSMTSLNSSGYQAPGQSLATPNSSARDLGSPLASSPGQEFRQSFQSQNFPARRSLGSNGFANPTQSGFGGQPFGVQSLVRSTGAQGSSAAAAAKAIKTAMSERQQLGASPA